MKRQIVIILGMLLVLLSLFFSISYAENLKPRYIPEKPLISSIPEGFDSKHIEVKFVDGLDIGMVKNNILQDRSGADLSLMTTKLFTAISNSNGHWLRMTGDNEQQMDDKRQIAEQFHKRQIADLNNYFILTVPENIDAVTWLNELNSLSEIEIAQALTLPAAPPVSDRSRGSIR